MRRTIVEVVECEVEHEDNVLFLSVDPQNAAAKLREEIDSHFPEFMTFRPESAFDIGVCVMNGMTLESVLGNKAIIASWRMGAPLLERPDNT